jgi:cysteine-rich repeat protein
MRRLGLFFLAAGFFLGCGDDDSGTTNDNNLNNNENSGVCGDGNLDVGEVCDDGSANSDTVADACRSDCRQAYCGDSVVDPGNSEICDDGGTTDGDGCDATCEVELGWDCSTGTCEEICGDNLAVGDEACDGSDLQEQDCISLGQPLGRLECDVACDQYDATLCTGSYVCGDGTVDPGEDCDDAGESATCDTDCTPALCGDGWTNTTAGEACDDGNTDDGDYCAADCQSGTCPPGSSCVEDPPGIWEGPVIRHSSAVGSLLPSCPAEFPTHLMDLNDELQSPGSCDCSCGDPVGVNCNGATLRESNSGSCLSVSLPLVSLVAGVCTAVSLDANFPYLRLGVPAISGGACSSDTVNNLLPPYWDNQIRVCGDANASPAGCSATEVCVADAGVGYESQRCVFTVGNLSCPVGSSYSQKFVHYSGFSEGRTCGGCSCGDPVGSCEGSVQLTNPCSLPPTVIGSLQPNQCTSVDTSAAAATYESAPVGSCQESAGQIQNSADGTGAVTFCCQP